MRRLGPAFVVMTLLVAPTLAGAQTGPRIAKLTLAGTNLPPGPLDLINTYTSNTVFYTFYYALAGTGQIPPGARIQEVRFLISSGTFEPGTKQAQIRAFMTNGTVDSVVQLPTGASGSPPTTETLDVYGVNQYVYGGGGTFTTNPYTNLPWTLADLQRIWAGYHARWTTPAGGARDWQRLSFNDYTVEVVYFTGPVPTLTVSAPTVPRTGMATFTVTADPTADPPAVVSNWTFASPGLSAVVRTAGTTNTTWSGLIAAPGTASVRVVQNGETFNLSAPIAVTPRNWTWVAGVAQPVPNGTFDQLPTPPVLGGRLGAARLDVAFGFDAGTITDQGPNHGLKFVVAVRNFNSTNPTRFRYQLSPDLMANNSAFYKAQCGTYDANQNPNGFIRGQVLRANVQEHEFGTILGHYQQYGVALTNPLDNLGQVAEGKIGEAATDLSAFISGVANELSGAGTRVQAVTAFEACNQFVERDTTCTFRGRINFLPYASCR